MNKATYTGSIDRSARVRRIKRVLVFLIAALLVMPTIMCGCLFAKMNKIEKQIYELSLTKEKHTVVTENTTFIEAKESEPEAKVYEATPIIKEETPAEVDEEDEKLNTDNTKDNSENDEADTADSDEKSEDSVKSDNENLKLKKVYLTFDDGPSCHTERILDILNEYDAKATFFVNGKESDSLKPLYKKITDEGHKIGMHSYTHIYKQIYANKDAFTYDLDRIESYIYEQTGVIPDIYRFPGGSSNTVSRISMSEFADVLNKRGIKYYDWNVVSGDASSTYGLPADVIYNNVVNGAMNQEEAVILMHDLPEKSTTVEALPRILEKFTSMGVEILPIDENTLECHQAFSK